MLIRTLRLTFAITILLFTATAPAGDGRSRNIDAGGGNGRPPYPGLQHGHFPPPPQGNNRGGRAAGINPWVQLGIHFGERAIQEAAKNNNRSSGFRAPPAPQPTFVRPPQNVYVQPPQTRPMSAPVVRVPSNSLPKRTPATVAVPRNVVPKPRPRSITSPRNHALALTGLRDLNQAQFTRLTDTLDQKFDDSVDDLNAGVGSYNELAGEIVTSLPISDEDRDRLNTAIATGDPDSIRDYFRQNPLPDGNRDAVDTIVAAAEMNQAFNRFNDGMNNGAGPDDLRRILDDLNAARGRLNDGLTGMGTMRDALNQADNTLSQGLMDLQGILAIMPGLLNPDAGCADGALANDFPCIFVPWLPAGDCYPAGFGMVCGTGGTGEFCIRETCLQDLWDVPLCAGEALPNSDQELAGDAVVTVMNPAETGGPIVFLIGNAHHTLDAGQMQQFTALQSTIIEFDRGNGAEHARYKLEPGLTYQFAITDNGWELRKKSFTVTIDNGENGHEFLYVLNNEVITVPAGGSRRHESLRPLEVRFDQGSGQETRKLLDSGTYRVGVSHETLTWDLFPAEGTATGLTIRSAQRLLTPQSSGITALMPGD